MCYHLKRSPPLAHRNSFFIYSWHFRVFRSLLYFQILSIRVYVFYNSRYSYRFAVSPSHNRSIKQLLGETNLIKWRNLRRIKTNEINRIKRRSASDEMMEVFYLWSGGRKSWSRWIMNFKTADETIRTLWAYSRKSQIFYYANEITQPDTYSRNYSANF